MNSDFTITPLKGVGPIRFGVSRMSARSNLGDDFKSFKRGLGTIQSDYYHSNRIFIYYNTVNEVEAVEFATPAQPRFKGKSLLDMSYSDLKLFLIAEDPTVEIASGQITSHQLGIGAYAPHWEEYPSSPVQNVIVFEQGYYN